MDLKSFQMRKIAKAKQFQNLKLYKSECEEEKEAVDNLKKLYVETVKLEVELQTEIYESEKLFDGQHAKIFDQRRKIIENFKNNPKICDGTGDVEYGLNKFWLKVLKSSYPEFITPRDEKMLGHLIDMRTKFDTQPSVHFTIIFVFEPNDYFENETLSKTYYIKCVPEEENFFSFDGAEIYKCEGCKIDWKSPYDKQSDPTFFDFFNPPALPEDPLDEQYIEINALLENDFELGFYLKERVIPKAILFYTGELQDCNISDIESDNEDLDIEYEEVDEETDDEN